MGDLAPTDQPCRRLVSTRRPGSADSSAESGTSGPTPTSCRSRVLPTLRRLASTRASASPTSTPRRRRSVEIEGVANAEEARFYEGKRVAYVYTAQKAIG